MSTVFEPNNPISRRSFLRNSTLLAAGRTVEQAVKAVQDIRPVGEALVAGGVILLNAIDARAQACPPLPTDGSPPAPCEPNGIEYTARSRFYRLYAEDDGNGVFDANDHLLRGVPDATIRVESIKPQRLGDYSQFGERKVLPNGQVEYFDEKNKIWRVVESTKDLYVPSDGGDSTAMDLATNLPFMEWKRMGDGTLDKVWTVRRGSNSCEIDCGWNCVQWFVYSRMTADRKSILIGKDGKPESYTGYAFYFPQGVEPTVHDWGSYSHITRQRLADLGLTEGYVKKPRAFNELPEQIKGYPGN